MGRAWGGNGERATSVGHEWSAFEKPFLWRPCKRNTHEAKEELLLRWTTARQSKMLSSRTPAGTACSLLSHKKKETTLYHCYFGFLSTFCKVNATKRMSFAIGLISFPIYCILLNDYRDISVPSKP